MSEDQDQDFTPDLEPDEGQDYIEPSDGSSQGKGDQNPPEDSDTKVDVPAPPLPDEEVIA